MQNLKRLKVYYLDDEIDLLDTFIEVFSGPDVEIKIFSIPAELHEAVKLDPPDLVFLDFRMPGITGDLVAKDLPKDIWKILLTGDLALQPKAAFERVIKKPLHPNEITSIFIEALERIKAKAS